MKSKKRTGTKKTPAVVAVMENKIKKKTKKLWVVLSWNKKMQRQTCKFCYRIYLISTHTVYLN